MFIFFRRILLAVLFAWSTLNIIGNIQTAESVREHRGEILQMILGIATAPPWWIPMLLLLAVLVFAFWIEHGATPWWTDIAKKENSTYHAAIGLIADPDTDAYLPLSAFWRSGGYELPKRSVIKVFNRMAKVSLPPVPSDMPKAEWFPFVKRAREVGRNLSNNYEVAAALDEWRESGSLRPVWDMEEPTNFPTFAPGLSVSVPTFEYDEESGQLIGELLFRNMGVTQRTVISVLVVYRGDQSDSGWQIISPTTNFSPFLGNAVNLTVSNGDEKPMSLRVACKKDFFFKVGSQTGLIVNFTNRSGKTASQTIPIREVMPSNLHVGYSIQSRNIEALPLI